MVLPIAWTSAACEPRGRAGVLSEFKIAFDQSEVRPRLIGLPQREGVFV